MPEAPCQTSGAGSKWSTFQQLQTYKAEVRSLFAFNDLLVVSDGVEARVGTFTAGREWFKPWRTVSSERPADPHLPELQIVLEGLFEKRRLLDLIRDFIVFEDDGSGALVKKMAGYHQFHAVQVAVAETLRAAELRREADRVAEITGSYEAGVRAGGKPGDRRIGVVWHTQGSGKSLTMAFYAGRIIREPTMENPTLVVLTDRNDLDDQLFTTFSRCSELLRQPPVQAESRAAVALMLEKYEVCCGLFHGFDWSRWVTGTPQERLGLLPSAQEHILKQENGKDRCLCAVRELFQAFALAVPHEEALRIHDDVAFFQAVQAVLAKRAPGDARPGEELDHAVRQITSRAVVPEGVMDIFAAAGLEKPDISILSEEFLAEVRDMPQRNLAVELLRKLLQGELRTRRRKNVVQARSFAEMLEQTIRRYQTGPLGRHRSLRS